jgi:hypothetical protein
MQQQMQLQQTLKSSVPAAAYRQMLLLRLTILSHQTCSQLRTASPIGWAQQVLTHQQGWRQQQGWRLPGLTQPAATVAAAAACGMQQQRSVQAPLQPPRPTSIWVVLVCRLKMQQQRGM